MYFTEGLNPNELGDFDVVEHDGRLHAFYLALPSQDEIGHLTSSDGINWQALPPAIRTGVPGDFDFDQIWTMGVFRKDDSWFMLYTANLNQGTVQVIGLATSTDLVSWERHGDSPVIVPDPRWYEAEQIGNYRVDWRDPHVVVKDGKCHGFLCARENHGLLNHRGCAAYFSSDDGYHWEVGPPACTPRNCYDYECPSVFELDGRFYMVAIHGGHARMTWRVADRIEGPYRRPYDDSLLPGRNMSVRPCVFNGELHLFHWNRGERDWGTKHPAFAVLASPKKVKTDAAGNLVVESFDWSSQHAGPAEKITQSTSAASSCGEWSWTSHGLLGTCEPGTGIWLTREGFEDFEISTEVELGVDQAREFGFVIRADHTGDQALYACCIPGRYSCELVKQVYNRRNGPESLWRGRSVMQAFHFTPSGSGHYFLRLIAFGPNIEFNVNGRLVISQLTMPRRSGHVGLFVEDGVASFSNTTITRLNAPGTNWYR